MCKTTCLGCGKKIEECICCEYDTHTGGYQFPPSGTIYARCLDTDKEIDDLHETLTSMRNRIDVLLELNEHDDLAHTIPTILEDLYEECQRLVEDYAFDNA
jgi:hypothetical protein